MTRRTGPKRVRRLLAAALALAASLALTACNPDQVGAAAVVDGSRITVSQLQDATKGFHTLAPQVDQGEAQLRILERMILSKVIDRAAHDAGVSVTDGEVAAATEQITASIGGRDQLVRALAQQQPPTVLAPSYIDRWTRDRLLFTKLAAKLAGGAPPTSQQAGIAASNALVAAGKKMDIEVNPRYGTWNPSRGLDAEISGGLSKTVQELNSPTPAQ